MTDKTSTHDFLNDSAEDIVSRALAEFQEEVSADTRRERTREKVTIRITQLYCICTLAIVLVSLYEIYKGHYEAIESMKSVVAFLNALVLPIITLVLGFYFGSQQNNNQSS